MEENKKYEILFEEDHIVVNGHNLYRIKALKDFSDIKTGDLGGWVESYTNLSQRGNCWLYGENTKALKNAKVEDNACLYDNSFITNNAKCRDNSKMFKNSSLLCSSTLEDNSIITEHACISNNAHLIHDSFIGGAVTVYENAIFSENAYIENSRDYIVISPIGSDNTTITAFKTKNGKVKFNFLNKTHLMSDMRFLFMNNSDEKNFYQEFVEVFNLCEKRFFVKP